jgi:hypothetical protein
MNITIKNKLENTLEEEALKDGVSKEVWVERKINAILSGLRLKNLEETIKESVDDYEVAIKNKKAEIKLSNKEEEKTEPIFN